MRRIYAIILALGLLGACPAAVRAEQSPQSGVELVVRKGVVKIANTGDEPLEVNIYAITGALVSNFTVESGAEETVELSSGYYIVKAADTVRRVAV